MQRLVLALFLLGGGAGEGDLLKDAAALRDKGQWQAALEKYEKVLAAPSGERAYTIALHHAVDCETRLGRYEKAADRIRAAKLPNDRTLRDVIVLLHLEMLRDAQLYYGNPEETEEGAQGSAKLSKAQARKELEAQIATLMADHATLDKTPLSAWSEFAEIKDVDPVRFATVWDLVVLRLADALGSLPREKMAPPDPMLFVQPDFPHQMAADAHPLLRMGALYEDSGERWRVQRVQIPRHYGTNTAALRKPYVEKASARLREFMTTLHTAVARYDAGVDAAELLGELDRPPEALALCEKVMAQAPESDDAALRCRRLRHEITQHELALQTHAVRMPGKSALHVRAHNIGTLFLRLYRVDPLKDLPAKELFANAMHDMRPERVQSFMRWSWPAAEWQADLKDPGDHRWFERDLDVKAPANGPFLVVASEDKGFSLGQKVVAAAMVDVGDLAIARAETREGVVFYTFDKGEPVAQAAVHVAYSNDWGKVHREELHTGADGVALWHAPDRQSWYDAIGKRADSWAWFGSAGYHYAEQPQPPIFLFLATDRPIYRPGQSVQTRVTAIERGGDQGPRIAYGHKVILELRDANGRQIAQTTVTTGNFGSAHAKFDIAGGALLGQYQLIARLPDDNRVQSSIAVAVEEYKRPEFEITLETLKGAAKYGQKATLPGKVTYYFGGPAPDVVVRYTVTRKRWIPWWAWQRGESAAVEIARGQTKTNAEGKYEITFVPEKDISVVTDDDPDLPRVDDFEVHVDAHDAGGRTLEASRTLRLGEKSLLVQLESEHGFWMSDEASHLTARLVNLDEAGVAGQGNWELWKLGAPKETPKPSNVALQRVLRDYPAEAKVGSGSVAFAADKSTSIALPKVAAGGYRLVVTTKDPFGQTVRGVYAILVADAKSRAIALPLPPIALLRETEVEPGGTAQLLAGGTAASGAYHVEVWRDRDRRMHRVERGAPVRVVDIAVGSGERGGFTVRWLGAAGLQIVGGEANVRVPRRDKELVVKFDSHPDAVEPGGKVRYGVRAVDGRGKPVEMEALVAVYDRSLELYAKQTPPWVDALYTPPAEPPARADGQIDIWGTTEPFDRAVQEAIEKSIRKSWKPHALPRFAWEANEDRDADGIPDSMDEAEAVTINGLEGHMGRMREQVFRSKARLTLLSETVMSGEVAKEEKPAFGGYMYAKKNAPPPPPPAPRVNMAETALFLPYLHTGADGRGSFEFNAPERLTSWRVKLSGLGRAVQAGTASDQFVTRKQLMVRVEIPRFLREGDRSQVTAVVHNETDKPLEGRVDLGGADGLGANDHTRTVKIPAHGLASVDFKITAPEGLANYKLRASVRAGSLADAEERELPVLPSRERLIASRLAALKGEDAKDLVFEDLAHSNDPSLRSESLVVSVEPQLALSILRSIPSLIEYPYECVEQTVDRYVPLAIISEIYKKHPELAHAIAVQPHRKTQHEPWLADDTRRMTSLVETPWLAQSQGGSDDDRLIDLLDPALVTRLRSSTEDKLARMQNGDGSFAWFPGGHGDFYMTLFVLDGMANLTEFGIEPPNSITRRAINYVVSELPRHMTKEESELSLLAYGAHVLTAFDPQKFPEAQRARKEVASWMKFVLANRQILTPLGRAYAARTMERLGNHPLAMELLESALDGSRTDPLIGTYWTPERYSWRWYSDSVEKHAYFMRVLAALSPKDPRIAGMAQWLLWNRKGNAWHSTKASAAAVYALLDVMQKQGALEKPERFHVKWGKYDENVVVRPDDARKEPLFWKAAGNEVTPALAKVHVEKTGPGIAFASATWMYSSTKLQSAHGSDAANVERKYFMRVHKSDGDHLEPLASGARVHVGDEIEVRLYVKTRSQFEYVQIKEPHGAGFEESALRSGWRWGQLSYYLEPRDSLLNFFVGWMPHGEFELRHVLRPTTPGRYRIGSAVLQSMYSPDITAYSSGMELEVER